MLRSALRSTLLQFATLCLLVAGTSLGLYSLLQPSPEWIATTGQDPRPARVLSGLLVEAMLVGLFLIALVTEGCRHLTNSLTDQRNTTTAFSQVLWALGFGMVGMAIHVVCSLDALPRLPPSVWKLIAIFIVGAFLTVGKELYDMAQRHSWPPSGALTLLVTLGVLYALPLIL